MRELYHVYGAPTYSLGGTGRDSEDFEEVQVTTIDQAVRAANLGPVSCIKIDVEGAEELVLRGAKETIERSRPTIIFEVNRTLRIAWGSTRIAAVSLLRTFGYRFDLVSKGGLEEMKGDPGDRNVVRATSAPHSA